MFRSSEPHHAHHEWVEWIAHTGAIARRLGKTCRLVLGEGQIRELAEGVDQES
jgi:hypothetical protein